MTLRYKRRYQPRLRRTWLLSPYHRIGHSGIVVLAGFGFRGIEIGDWVTHRSQHFASYDTFFTTVDVWESTDGEIVALRLLPYREHTAARLHTLNGKSLISELAEWIIGFCEDPPRYQGKFITGPVRDKYLSEHSLMLASWMDSLFSGSAPELAAELVGALNLLANGEIGSPQLKMATNDARIALDKFSVEAPSDMVHVIGSGPKGDLVGSSGWAYAVCRLLGLGRAPIANPHPQGSQPQEIRRGRIGTQGSRDFQLLIKRAHKEFGLDQLASARSQLAKAFAAETSDDLASAVSSSFEHALEELSSSGIPERVLRRRLMDLGVLVRFMIDDVSEKFDRTPSIKAIDYAAFLLSCEATIDVGFEIASEILHSAAEESDADKPDTNLPPGTDEESVRQWAIHQSWQETLRLTQEVTLPYAYWNGATVETEELVSSLAFPAEVRQRVIELCGELSSIPFKSQITETGTLSSLMISNPMLSESSNNLNCANIEGKWVYWTSNWEYSQAGLFSEWVSEQSEQLQKLDVLRQQATARRRDRWRHIAEYRIPHLPDDAWSDEEIELPDIEWFEYGLDPDGDMLVEICAMGNQSARLVDIVYFLDGYNPEWLDDGGGMIRSGWRSPGCSFNTRIPEIGKYAQVVGELYDLTGVWICLDDIVVDS